MKPKNDLKYDPGVPSVRRAPKHKWGRRGPGFQVEEGELIGKCGTDITLPIATDLLNNGIRLGDSTNPTLPQNVVSVYQGIPFIAKPTRIEESSYHGFPARERDIRRLISKFKCNDLKDQLLDRCSSEEQKVFKSWLDKNP